MVEPVEAEKQVLVIKAPETVIQRLRPYVVTVAFMSGVGAALIGTTGALVHCARIGDAWGCVAAAIAGFGVALNAVLNA